jgi:hypothetical protein
MKTKKGFEKIALVLQGPLTFNTLLSLYKYKDYHEITVVAPVQDSTKSIAEEIVRMTDEKENHISFFNYDAKILRDQNNSQNKFFHFYSTELGLRNVSKDFVVKVRNDEFYSNLDPFFETVLNNPQKVTTGDVFFRRHDYYPFHPSDHLVGGKTEVMLKGFATAREIAEDLEIAKNHEIFKISGIPLENITSEQIMGLSFISVIHTKYAMESPINVMKSVFEIVPTERLGTFNIKQNHKNEDYTTLRFFEIDKDIKDIEDYGKNYNKLTENTLRPGPQR